MTYVSRSYEEIVRDMLTTLTGGTVRESLTVMAGGTDILPAKLKNRPVRRISHLEGRTLMGVGANAKEVPYRFTAADFELVSSSGNPDETDSIRFRENGRRPVPGSTLVVNYYPVQTDPVPLTDLNVGSVTRTLMETVARELAVIHQHLKLIYDSAFLASATDDSLDKVVALVGVGRLPSGHPVTRLRFSRQAGVPGSITVPVGTAVTDAEANRYLTLADITLEPNETTREILASGETAATAEVAEGALNRLETMIAGISEVGNIQPARKLTAPESDDDLRRRARGALHGTVRGTCDALKFGILSVAGVKAVQIEEAPNGVAGEIRLQIAYTDKSPEVKTRVRHVIQTIRPAGIRVIDADAAGLRVGVKAMLTLAGASLPAAELNALTAGFEERIVGYLTTVPPGGTVRRSKITKAAMTDDRIVDAQIQLTPEGQPPVPELTLDAGVVLDIVRPFVFDAPAFEDAATAVPTASAVGATLPVLLAAGVTLEQAQHAIMLALDGFLASRRADSPLTVDALAAAIRDDSRFALVRADVLVTVEGDGRFLQLTDGVGSYAPATNESLQRSAIDIQPREGGI